MPDDGELNPDNDQTDSDTSTSDSQESQMQAAILECSRISDGPRKILCRAMALEDITMCGQIEGKFRDECVVVLAELVYDTSLSSNCDLANVADNKKICRALISEDINNCFTAWTQGEGLGASLSMRDCIDLTSRKLKDQSKCDVFITRMNEIHGVCGDTSDCQGQWIDGATDHAQECKGAVELAMGYD